MNDEDKTFLELFYEQQPNIFYLSLAVILIIIIFYFLTRWYVFGSFSLQENIKILFYLLLQFTLIFYEFYPAFQKCDIVQLSIFIIPIFLSHFTLCSYIKLESIVTSYDRFSKDSNKMIVRMIVGIILLFGFIECYLCILNNKIVMESYVKSNFFIIDKYQLSLVKSPIILSLFHAQTINLFCALNYFAFLLCIQLHASSLFMINFSWFLNSLHELFQTFLSIYLSENIIRAVPDSIFHASFALFYFLKQKACATLIQAIKEKFLMFLIEDEIKEKEEENQNEVNIDIAEMINNEVVFEESEYKFDDEVDNNNDVDYRKFTDDEEENNNDNKFTDNEIENNNDNDDNKFTDDEVENNDDDYHKFTNDEIDNSVEDNKSNDDENFS